MKDRIKNMLKKYGLSGVNKPKKTPSHPTKKGIVLAKVGDKVRLIRFGDQKMGHNYSPEARKASLRPGCSRRPRGYRPSRGCG